MMIQQSFGWRVSIYISAELCHAVSPFPAHLVVLCYLLAREGLAGGVLDGLDCSDLSDGHGVNVIT